MITLPKLSLPLHKVRLRKRPAGGFDIFDPLRHRFVALTPEEYVRSQFTAWLISDLGYPVSLMSNEVALTLGGVRRRCDTLVFSRRTTHFMVVEYKAPEVKITQEVFDQIARYNMVLKADYLVVSNGLTHYCCRINHADGTYEFLPSIPAYPAQ